MLKKISKICKKIQIVGLGRAAKVGLNRFYFKGPKAHNCDLHPFIISKQLYWPADIKSLYIQPSFLRNYGGKVCHKCSFAWHEGYEDMAHTYYKDIAIQYGQGPELGPDIKRAWDRSRFLYAPSMQPAEFEAAVSDWLAHNPYLYGINWLCPMEVAIRAINWIIGFFVHDLSDQFQKKIVCSLYNHMIYLEHTWELSDGRTSNHYLSDLVGYLYLVWFFNDVKKQRWVINEIEREMSWQIFDEGTSYEGSTAYHRLVTELFVHADLMATECDLQFSDAFYEKLKKMKEFVWWTGDVKIGDDDSGKISLFNILSQCEVIGAQTYKEFGISIIKTDVWHITLRHAAYQPRQPTGHFHDDAGSFTIAYNGIAVLVDPGSYVYTPSRVWRDHFRSAKTHNKLYSKYCKKIVNESEMFTITLPIAHCDEKVIKNNSTYIVEASYSIDLECAQCAHKKLECDTLISSVRISDMVDQECDDEIFSNLTFAPDITVEKKDDCWIIFHKEKPILKMRTQYAYQKYDAWVAPEYGTKIKTVGLRARVHAAHMITNFVPL